MTNEKIVVFGTPVSLGWIALGIASGILPWVAFGGGATFALAFGITRHWQSSLVAGLSVAGLISAWGIRQMFTAGL